MNLEPFVTRVKAAVLLHASTFPLGGADSAGKNFAIFILKNPGYEEVSMTALVAADPTVLGQISLDGQIANVDAVTDAAIKAVVAARWNLVAAKYPVVPATAPAA